DPGEPAQRHDPDRLGRVRQPESGGGGLPGRADPAADSGGGGVLRAVVGEHVTVPIRPSSRPVLGNDQFDGVIVEPLNHSRRGFLRLAGLAGATWLTPIGHLLSRASEKSREPATSIIMLWLQGGPSQLETFDPHPGTRIAGGTGSIKTAVNGIELAPGLEHTAEGMGSIALVRSMMSKEGDHARGTYTMKTGFRPDPTVIHPSIGAVCCHELPATGVDIPRHVSILPGQWAARGGFLGDQYDAFRMDDPAGPVPDTQS